jgi:hypothetical protein
MSLSLFRQTLPCPVCKKLLSSQGTLKKHLETVHKQTTEPTRKTSFEGSRSTLSGQQMHPPRHQSSSLSAQQLNQHQQHQRQQQQPQQQQTLGGQSQSVQQLASSLAAPSRPSLMTRPIYGAPLPRPQLNGVPGRYLPPNFQGPVQMRPRPQMPQPLLLSSRLLPLPTPRPPHPTLPPPPIPPPSSS